MVAEVDRADLLTLFREFDDDNNGVPAADSTLYFLRRPPLWESSFFPKFMQPAIRLCRDCIEDSAFHSFFEPSTATGCTADHERRGVPGEAAATRGLRRAEGRLFFIPEGGILEASTSQSHGRFSYYCRLGHCVMFFPLNF